MHSTHIITTYQYGTMWLRKKVLVNSGSSAFLAVVLRAHMKHWYSSVSIHSTNKTCFCWAAADIPTNTAATSITTIMRATDKDNRPQTRAMMPLLLLLHCPSYHLASRWGQSNRRAMMCDAIPHHGHRSDTSRNMRALLYLVRNWAIVVITCLGNSVWDGQGKNIQNFPGCVGKSVQLSAISGMQLGKCGSNWSR